jgi:hypothetical protein
MFHFKESIQNTKGDALIGYFVRLADTSDDSGISLYADSNSTPIVSISGLADAALVDSDGMADFWVPSGTYHMDIYATDGATLVRRETFMQMGVPAGDYGDVTVADGDSWTVNLSAIGISDGDKGDIVISSSGTVWTIDSAAVSLSKMANLAANSIIGNNTGSAATPIALTASQVKTLLSLVVGTDVQAYSTKLAAIAANTVTTDSSTARTAALADADTFIRFTSSSAVTFTIPPNSSVEFPVGTQIEFSQSGSGAVSVAAGAGVTINSRAADLTLAGQYAVAFVKKVATDTWIMNGDL